MDSVSGPKVRTKLLLGYIRSLFYLVSKRNKMRWKLCVLRYDRWSPSKLRQACLVVGEIWLAKLYYFAISGISDSISTSNMHVSTCVWVYYTWNFDILSTYIFYKHKWKLIYSNLIVHLDRPVMSWWVWYTFKLWVWDIINDILVLPNRKCRGTSIRILSGRKHRVTTRILWIYVWIRRERRIQKRDIFNTLYRLDKEHL